MPRQSPSIIRRRRLGAELRRLRERAGYTGDEAAEAFGWSSSKISRIETARTGIKHDDLRRLLDLYRVGDEHRPEVMALAHESARTEWVDDTVLAGFPADYAELVYAEAEAVEMWDWEPQVMPGLLQTADYARGVMVGWNSMFRLPPGDIDQRVDARMARQHVLTRDQPLELSVVIDQSVILRQLGTQSVMRQQLLHLAEVADMPNVSVRVLPLGGMHSIGTGTFAYMRFAQVHDIPLPDVVIVEQLVGSSHIDDPEDTNMYRVVFEQLTADSLEPAASRDLISRTARETWR